MHFSCNLTCRFKVIFMFQRSSVVVYNLFSFAMFSVIGSIYPYFPPFQVLLNVYGQQVDNISTNYFNDVQ